MCVRLICVSLVFIATACNRPSVIEVPVSAKVLVDVTGLAHGMVKDELILFANTLYLKRNVVTSPIPAFITQVFIKLGDAVKEGEILYQFETKERRALGSQALLSDSSIMAMGKISVRAPASGIISTLDKQQLGDYVLEGTQLCTIAESNALAFSVNVPFEYSAFAKTGMKCTLVLPDGSRHSGTFTTPLTTMNSVSQTQTVLARSDDRMFLPENLIVKIIVDRSSGKEHQVLPKACVLSDEMLKNFWVMKLLNDSIAIKVPVTLGNKNPESIEILTPLFKPNDRFLRTGNYGLPDTAYVTINH